MPRGLFTHLQRVDIWAVFPLLVLWTTLLQHSCLELLRKCFFSFFRDIPQRYRYSRLHFFFFFFWEIEKACMWTMGERERREAQTGSTPSIESDTGLDPTTLRPGPAQANIKRTLDRATQVPLCFTLWGTAKMFSTVIYHFKFSPAMQKDSNFSTSLPKLVTHCLAFY